MATKDKIQQIINNIAGMASSAAGGVSDAMQSAGSVVSSKYDALKLNAEMARLREEQKELFTEIGRTMFLVQSGAFTPGPTAEGGEAVDAQQTIDALLLQAEQKQNTIDEDTEKLYALSGEQVCPVCSHVCKAEDAYCSVCGAKLPERPQPPAPQPEEVPGEDEGVATDAPAEEPPSQE